MSDFKFEFWPTEYLVITQYFGANPQNYGQFGLPGHDGLDIRAPHGSKVFCVAPGRVLRVHTNPSNHNYGIHVRVQHKDGYKTIYAHLERALVREGENVEAGTLLGIADDTGNSFGSHLHLTLKKQGVRQGNWPHNIIDPTPFILPLMGWKEPAGPFLEGKVLSAAIVIAGKLAQANAGGATLWLDNGDSYRVPDGTIMIVSGDNQAGQRSVKVPAVALGLGSPSPPPPGPEPPPTVATVEGWAWTSYLTITGDVAVVGGHGINLRVEPHRNASNIGLVRSHSTVTVLGVPQGDYVRIRVRRSDFIGPVNLPDVTSEVLPPDAIQVLPADSYIGWVTPRFLTVTGRRALISRLGTTLRNRSDSSAQNVGLVKAFATVTIAGPNRGGYTPILVRKVDVLKLANPMPAVELPDPFPEDVPPPPPPLPIHDTTPGWAFSSGIRIAGDKATAGPQGINLRDAPRRDASIIGYVPPNSEMIVTGVPQGEYTPVRVDDALLQPPREATDSPEPAIIGQARIGLHASADPHISEAEHAEFTALRPDIIKVLSFHSPQDIARLAGAHPGASWIVRAFLSFGGRSISPDQFLNDTLSDVKRTLDRLKGKEVVVELHNEPNLYAEGLGSGWSDGAKFGAWFSDLLLKYRRALPRVRFIYPGLSPGHAVAGVKHDHIQFIEASRAAVEAADGLGVHLYWSRVYPMGYALATLDDYISRFRSKYIWITEASNNKGGTSPAEKGRQYLHFWQELQKRPVVQGVTYFVASASNPQFAEEVWVGRNIGAILGRR